MREAEPTTPYPTRHVQTILSTGSHRIEAVEAAHTLLGVRASQEGERQAAEHLRWGAEDRSRQQPEANSYTRQKQTGRGQTD